MDTLYTKSLKRVAEIIHAHKRLNVAARDVTILMDTSGIKHLANINDITSFTRTPTGERYRVTLASSVVKQLENQMQKNPSTFPQTLYLQIALLNPQITAKFVSPEDELAVLEASEATSYGRREEGDYHPGWADTNQLGLMRKRAKQGKKSILITDDTHLRDMVNYMRRNEPRIKDNVLTASILRYSNTLNAA